MVLNNIACCNFLLGNHVAALANFCEASDIHKQLVGSSAREELDLLHVAITLCNMGYMQIRLKQYEVARGVFEEALMIQQSVYGDEENIAIKNTLSNMDFTNAFHSWAIQMNLPGQMELSSVLDNRWYWFQKNLPSILRCGI